MDANLYTCINSRRPVLFLLPPPQETMPPPLFNYDSSAQPLLTDMQVIMRLENGFGL